MGQVNKPEQGEKESMSTKGNEENTYEKVAGQSKEQQENLRNHRIDG